MNEKKNSDGAAQRILSLSAETVYATDGIVSRTLLQNAELRVVLFGFSAGQELTEHTSTQHALVQILSGECEFSLDGAVKSLKAGDFFYMAPNQRHAVKATVSFSMLLTLVKPAAGNGRLFADNKMTGFKPAVAPAIAGTAREN